MTKLMIKYKDTEEKEDLLHILKSRFNVIKISKEYKKEGSYNRIYVDLQNK